MNKSSIKIILCLVLLSLIGVAAQYNVSDFNIKYTLSHTYKILLGFFIMYLVYKINIKHIYNSIEILYILTIISLISVEIIGSINMGAQRWISLGGFNLQPSEIAKITTLLMISKGLHLTYNPDGHYKGYIRPAIYAIIPIALILKQPDLGTSLLICASVIFLFFVSGFKRSYIFILIASMMVIMPTIWYFAEDYQKDRVKVFLNPDSDPLGRGYNIRQAKIAIGAGGALGAGYGKGTQHTLNYIPEEETDFIFSVIAEDFGLIGAIAILLLIALIINESFKIAIANKQDKFQSYAVISMSSIFFLYVITNISMNVGIVPVVGVPLPLVSKGGSAALAVMICFGLILNINKQTLKKSKL